jgi:DNA invertase Pin-like site-specific DNA recombinase
MVEDMETTITLDAYGYIRVSSKSQSAEDRDGPVRQRAEIEAWGAAHGYRIVQWFEDSISGKTDGDDRPGFAAMMAALHANGTRTVIVERLDRLARTLRVQEIVIADFQKYEFTLISTAEPDLDNDNPDRVMIRQILGAVSQHTSSTLVAKLRGARLRARATDPDYKEGRKPYGALPGEEETIQRIRKLRADGKSLKEIAQKLTAEGRKPRKADHWHMSSIRLILSR